MRSWICPHGITKAMAMSLLLSVCCKRIASVCSSDATVLKSFYSTRNPLERRTMKELMGAVTGGRGGRGGRGRKKGGLRGGRQAFEIKIGRGKKGIRWPGLSYHLGRIEPGKWYEEDKLAIKEIEEETEDADISLGTVFTRDLQTGKRFERRVSEKNWDRKGWTGRQWGGRYVGCPETPDGSPLPEFRSTVIEMKRVANQTRGGKKRTASVLVVVGNGCGAAGFAVGKGEDIRTAVRKAKNKAVNCLQVIPRCNDHTVFHNIDTKFCKTRIFMEKTVPGNGLKCQRAISAVCNLVGIEDLRAKIVGSTNPLNIVRATFKGLASQQTHQSLANKSGKYVVEMRPETGYRPLVVGVPDQFKNKSSRKLQALQLLPKSSS